jgi:two-component system, chemotaxis family, protein-glutamate methylesterase/glutaminase
MVTDALRPAVELVALLASAGGLDPLLIVLSDLPGEFPAAIVVQQHLGGHSSVLPAILGGRTPHRVDWARDGQPVSRGQVLVCPPGMQMELTPDGLCRLRPMNAPGERRFDVLLASVASSYGPRCLAVVLSGSGRDGAEGTAAMKRAGAVVIAQSPDTAEFPSMPIAAARAGADLVLPIDEIGRVLTDIVEGAPLPPPREAPGAIPRETDWAAMPLKPFEEWPVEETDGFTTAAGGQSTDTGDVNTAHRDPLTRPSPTRTVDGAAARAEAARLRVAELRSRRQDLASGRGATARTAAIARLRAEESLRRAEQARQAASRAAARQAN